MDLHELIERIEEVKDALESLDTIKAKGETYISASRDSEEFYDIVWTCKSCGSSWIAYIDDKKHPGTEIGVHNYCPACGRKVTGLAVH